MPSESAAQTRRAATSAESGTSARSRAAWQARPRAGRFRPRARRSRPLTQRMRGPSNSGSFVRCRLDARLQRQRQRLGQAGGAEPVHHVAAMHLDGASRCRATARSACWMAGEQALQHLLLARGERGGALVRLAAPLAADRAAPRARRRPGSKQASRACSEKGFSMKSTAPNFIARTAIGTSPWPVITTTGQSTLRSASAAMTWKPSICGMRGRAGCSPARDRAAPRGNRRRCRKDAT